MPKGLPANSERTNDLLPPTRLEFHARNLRNESSYSQLRTLFQNSFIPYLKSLFAKDSYVFLIHFPKIFRKYPVNGKIYNLTVLVLLGNMPIWTLLKVKGVKGVKRTKFV